MAEYYLISQLPSLDGISENAPLPITQERFEELCAQFLSKKAQQVIKNLTIAPPKKSESSGSALIDAWNENERTLRFALGKIRAEKMGKDFDTEGRIFSIEQLRAVSEAMETENPMKAEEYLNRYRLALLETLRPMDNFSEDFIFYYGLKLKLLLRIRTFDTKRGEAAYKNIYEFILNGDRLEAKQ